MAHQKRRAWTVPTDQYRFLRWALFRLRWATILALLLVTLMQPTSGRGGVSTWLLVVLFAGYNLLIELLRDRVPQLRPYTAVTLLDLPVAGLLYGLAAEPGGPLFLLLFLATDCAAVSLPLRAALFYTGGAAAIATGIDIALLMWSPTAGDIRLLVVRIAMLLLVAVGMAILTRRLTMEQEAARAVRDINERLLLSGLREQAAALADRSEAERLATLDRLRADFIATVSHDLRTPLTAARAGLAMLEMSTSERLGGDERELLDTSRRNVEYLHILIADLLTFNELEAGVLRLDRAPLDLRAVVATAVRVVSPLMREKGQALERDLAERLPYEGDARRLEQVLVNLLANAHRHTPVGTRIAIGGRVAAGEIRLAVRDDGPGIPFAEQETIFRRFHRLDATGDGSGLGLAIARRIVELHGGRVWVESAPGRGTHFHIALPYHPEGGAT
jgi:signal transduction histidine kinase